MLKIKTHARRGFANVLKLNPGDPVATPIVAEISKLFAVDAEAREQGLSVEARHRLRQQKAPELLQKIKADIEAAKLGALPGGALEGACEYATRTTMKRLIVLLLAFAIAVNAQTKRELNPQTEGPLDMQTGRSNVYATGHWIETEGKSHALPSVSEIFCDRETMICREYTASHRSPLSMLRLCTARITKSTTSPAGRRMRLLRRSQTDTGVGCCIH